MSTLVSREALHYKERVLDITAKFNGFIQQTSDEELKKEIKGVIKSFSDDFKIVVMGQVNSGKSSFVNSLLGVEVCLVGSMPCTDRIHEIKHGEDTINFTLEEHYDRHFVKCDVIKDISIVDTPGVGSIYELHNDLTNRFITSGNLIIVVVSPDTLYNHDVWNSVCDLNRKFKKEVIFIVQKSDQLTNEEALQVRDYLNTKIRKEVGVEKPIFFVSSQLETMNMASGFESVKDYLRENYTTCDLIAKTQQSNVQKIADSTNLVVNSFRQRYLQSREDLRIVEEINKHIFEFSKIHDEKVKVLTRDIQNTMVGLIEEFRDEVIGNVSPFTVTEKFEGDYGKFHKWLSIRIKYYREKLDTSISLETQNAIKDYLGDLQGIVDTSSSLISSRRELLNINDRMYGTLVAQRKEILSDCSIVLKYVSDINKKLAHATNEYFMQVWESRTAFDNKVLAARLAGTALSAVGGGALVGGLGTAVSSSVVGAAVTSAGGAAASATVVTAAVTAAPVVAVIVAASAVALLSAYFGYKLTGIFSQKMFQGNITRKTVEAIKLFEHSIERIKEEVVQSSSQGVMDFFDKEYKKIDKYFVEFRKDVYLEESRVLQEMDLLQELVQQVNHLLGTPAEIGNE